MKEWRRKWRNLSARNKLKKRRSRKMRIEEGNNCTLIAKAAVPLPRCVIVAAAPSRL